MNVMCNVYYMYVYKQALSHNAQHQRPTAQVIRAIQLVLGSIGQPKFGFGPSPNRLYLRCGNHLTLFTKPPNTHKP